MIEKIKKMLKTILLPPPTEASREAVEDVVESVDERDKKQKKGKRRSPQGPQEPDLRSIGLFSDVDDEKTGDLIHALLYLRETAKLIPDPEMRGVNFYISTYGGSADDMFAIYDLMKSVQEDIEITTIGLGKVMSAGVLLLASGTKGKRKIGKNCRVMIHSVIAGNHGSWHNLVNELGAIEKMQDIYIDALVRETKMSKEEIKILLEQKVNIYLSAEEAIKLGIADEIV